MLLLNMNVQVVEFCNIWLTIVNRTINHLSIFRTDKVVVPSETETSENPATLFTEQQYKWPGILEFSRNWIAYANETNIVLKQGFPYRLSYLDKPEDDNFNHKIKMAQIWQITLRPPLQCHSRA